MEQKYDKLQADWSISFEYIIYSAPNKAARDEHIKNSEAAFLSEEVIRKCKIHQYLRKKRNEIYNEKWNEVKAIKITLYKEKISIDNLNIFC